MRLIGEALEVRLAPPRAIAMTVPSESISTWKRRVNFLGPEPEPAVGTRQVDRQVDTALGHDRAHAVGLIGPTAAVTIVNRRCALILPDARAIGRQGLRGIVRLRRPEDDPHHLALQPQHQQRLG